MKHKIHEVTFIYAAHACNTIYSPALYARYDKVLKHMPSEHQQLLVHIKKLKEQRLKKKKSIDPEDADMDTNETREVCQQHSTERHVHIIS